MQGTKIHDVLLDEDISFNEIESAMKGLKPGKACGPDLILNEM